MQKAEEGGMDPMALAQDVGDKLTKLTGALADMGVPPETMKKLERAMSLLGQVSSEVMGGSEGPIPESQGQVPMEAGAAGVPLGPQIKN